MDHLFASWTLRDNSGVDPQSLQALDAKSSSASFFARAPIGALGSFSASIPSSGASSSGASWTLDNLACLAATLRLDYRAELAQKLGCDPATNGDFSMLLQAWQRWGTDCVHHLEGGFAFAVWQPHQNRLFAARDHVGEFPLFYRQTPSLFSLSTRIQSLRLPGTPFDEQRVADWLINTAPSRSSTFFQGIQRLSAGQFLWATSTSCNVSQYWHPSDTPPTRFRRDSDYAEALRDLLERSTATRLPPSGGLGSQLSAGLDSSSVTSTAARLLAQRGDSLTAYTAVPLPGFMTRGFSSRLLPDEGPGAAAVAALYPNLRHRLISAGDDDLLPPVNAISAAMGEPILNGVNWLWISAILRAAREDGYSVLLQGAVGNGTISYETMYPLRTFFRTGRWLKLARMVYRHRAAGETSFRQSAAVAFKGLVPKWIDPRWSGDLKKFSLDYTAVNPAFAAEHELRQFAEESMFHDDLTAREEQRLLFERFDLASLHAGAADLHGVQFRDPTNDRRIWDFCFSIPTEQYVADGNSRSLVRRAMADRLPPSTINRFSSGQQGADWHITLTRALPAMHRQLDEIAQSPAAARFLDLARLRHLIQTFPTDNFQSPAIRRPYHLALVRGLTLGYFLRSNDPALVSSP